jgi:hypothetical protein
MPRLGGRFLLHGVLAASAALAAAAVPSAARAETVPAEYQGAWSLDCADPAAAQVVVGPDAVAVLTGGGRLSYAGLEVSRIWYGGIKATGDRVWLLVSKEPGQPFEFIVELAARKRGPLSLEEGHPDHGREMKRLFGPKFRYCGTDTATQAEPSPQTTKAAASLDVPIMEQGATARRLTACPAW